jgi:hypothetical protein
MAATAALDRMPDHGSIYTVEIFILALQQYTNQIVSKWLFVSARISPGVLRNCEVVRQQGVPRCLIFLRLLYSGRCSATRDKQLLPLSTCSRDRLSNISRVYLPLRYFTKA